MTEKQYERMVARLRAAVPDERLVRELLDSYERNKSDSVKDLEDFMRQISKNIKEIVR